MKGRRCEGVKGRSGPREWRAHTSHISKQHSVSAKISEEGPGNGSVIKASAKD